MAIPNSTVFLLMVNGSIESAEVKKNITVN